MRVPGEQQACNRRKSTLFGRFDGATCRRPMEGPDREERGSLEWEREGEVVRREKPVRDGRRGRVSMGSSLHQGRAPMSRA